MTESVIVPINPLEARVAALERSHESLRAVLSAETGRAAPMELGNTFFSPGDPVPSKGVTDLMDGMIYTFMVGAYKFPFVFKKNVSGGALKAGDRYADGIVDKTLRCVCEANNFFYLEI